MTPEERDAIRERWAKATPGPWTVCYDDTQPSLDALAAEVGRAIKHNDGLKLWGVVVKTPGERTEYAYPAITGNGPTSEANARAIASAPSDIAALLASADASHARAVEWAARCGHAEREREEALAKLAKAGLS